MQTAINTTPFWIGGGIIVAAALVALLVGRAVSTGHSLMIAVGAALVLVPYVSNFEWSANSIKFTTRQQTAELAQSLAQAAKDEVNLREQIAELAQGLKAATERIAALERNTGNGTGTETGGLTGFALEEWIKKNDAGKEDALNRFGTLQGLEQQLIRPDL